MRLFLLRATLLVCFLSSFLPFAAADEPAQESRLPVDNEIKLLRLKLDVEIRRYGEIRRENPSIVQGMEELVDECRQLSQEVVPRLSQGEPRDVLHRELETCLEALDSEFERIEANRYLSSTVFPFALGLGALLLVAVWGVHRYKRWQEICHDLDTTLGLWQERVEDAEARLARLQEDFPNYFASNGEQLSGVHASERRAVACEVNLVFRMLEEAKKRYGLAKLGRELSNMFFQRKGHRARQILSDEQVEVAVSDYWPKLAIGPENSSSYQTTADQLLEDLHRSARKVRRILETHGC